MAEIPIEKKSGLPGWLWPLLAALLAALLLWWLLSDNDEEEVRTTDTVATAPVETAAPVGAGTAAAVGAAAGAASAYTVGQTVSLDNARVTSLAGDTAFNVDANGQNMFVAFGEEPGRTATREGQIDVQPGMTVNLDGQVRSAAEQLPPGVTADQLGDASQYLYATEIEVVGQQ
jgi:hypothetical protein